MLYFNEMKRLCFCIPFVFFFMCCGSVQAQMTGLPQFGPNDTIYSMAIIYEGELMPYKELPNVYISNLPPDKLARVLEKYNRLRTAVYVTYPFCAQGRGYPQRRGRPSRKDPFQKGAEEIHQNTGKKN